MITLTTDFGTTDWFVGVMKGVIWGIDPDARIADLTHGIPSGDIRAGAFALAAAYRYFPRGTVHLAVVDPGVGSPRAGLAVQTRDYRFVGPDNGVLSLALEQEKVRTARRLENDAFFLQPISHTFHGRDVFAPVAAHLSRGVSIRKLGPEHRDYLRLSWPRACRERDTLIGEVVHLDHFGNAITNLATDQLSQADGWRVVVRGREHGPIREFYAEAKRGELTGILGSTGFLELAVRNGSAARRFGLRVGTVVRVARSRRAWPV